MEDFVVCVLVDGTHYTEIKNEEKDGRISSWALLDLFSGVLEFFNFFPSFLLGSLCFCPEGNFWPVFFGLWCKTFPISVVTNTNKSNSNVCES